MRLWSIHPGYLDKAGIVALWREGLLAQAVLSGKTQGYRRHPQLERFRLHRDPLGSLSAYLCHVWVEAQKRGYAFDRRKIRKAPSAETLPVTQGQLEYEFNHLMAKLKSRDRRRFMSLSRVGSPEAHPIFSVRKGPVEPWERQHF